MLTVSIIALVVSVLALAASGASVVYTRRQAHAAEQKTMLALAEDRRAREPTLSLSVHPATHDGSHAIYSVRNDGPQDLDSVVVCKPRPDDGINYPVAATGSTGWEDEAQIGPLALTQIGRFTLSIGTASSLPEFSVEIVCRAGDDEWRQVHQLAYPRRPPPPRNTTASFEVN